MTTAVSIRFRQRPQRKRAWLVLGWVQSAEQRKWRTSSHVDDCDGRTRTWISRYITPQGYFIRDTITFAKTWWFVVIAELEPSYYHLELPRLIELTLLSQPDCLPTPAARCCVAPLRSDPDQFIIGSEDGSLHTVRICIFRPFSSLSN